MIVKCQRSLSDSAGIPRMLFYTQDRRRLRMFDLTPEWYRLFGPLPKTRGDAAKTERFFAEVTWLDPNLPPTFIRRLPEQDW